MVDSVGIEDNVVVVIIRSGKQYAGGRRCEVLAYLRCRSAAAQLNSVLGGLPRPLQNRLARAAPEQHGKMRRRNRKLCSGFSRCVSNLWHAERANQVLGGRWKVGCGRREFELQVLASVVEILARR